MVIGYNFGHVFYPGADKVLNAQTLNLMVEFLVAVNLVYIKRMHALGYTVPSLYRSGVRYKRAGYWEPIPTLYGRTWGDCKSLASAKIAEDRFAGVYSVPSFRWAPNDDGTADYHILAQLGDQFEDPSKVLGMGDNEVARFYAADSY